MRFGDDIARSGQCAGTACARQRRGFTLIELLVVMAIMALVLSLALPKYFSSLDYSKEVVLRQNLQAVRHAIDRYRGDHGRYPASLEQLVQAHYLRQVPVDPLTESASSWKLVASPNAGESGVYDLKSGAAITGRDGSPVATW